MWVRFWFAISVSLTSVHSQFNIGIPHGGPAFGGVWGWQLSNIAKPDNINLEQAQNYYDPQLRTQITDIFHLQHPNKQLGQDLQIRNTPLYEKIHTQKEATHSEDSKPLERERSKEYQSPVRVFKDHNCTETKNIPEDLKNDMAQSMELFSEIPLHDIDSIPTSFHRAYSGGDNFFRGAVNFKVEPQTNARNERYYHTTVPTPAENTTLEGIDKLVASTQDLISSEDLLYINQAAEKYIHEQSEDIKPRSRYVFKTNGPGHDKRNTITVKAKIGNIVKSNKGVDNGQSKQVLDSDSNNYDFAAPIVVSEGSYDTFREQVVDNLVSTMVPYMENGYQIVGVKDTLEEQKRNNNRQENDVVSVTPRPINQNYLAPITVALRLINANESGVYNTVDDHEASDSEFIPDTVTSPVNEKTTVEIQESIPVDITHINDVEFHEYLVLDEGRSNKKGSFDVAKSHYDNMVDSSKSKKVQENLNKMYYRYEESKEATGDKNQEILDLSESYQDIQTVKANSNGDSNTERSEYIQYYEDFKNGNQKIIQPIIIEKEIPVTKFVDRYIEKKVPYPQQVEVQVPVDRPVPVPVPVEKIVEKPVEVTRYVDKPYPVEVPRPYPVEVPYPVEQKVFIDRPVHIPYPVEKVVEKQVLHPIAVPTPVGIPYGVPYPVEHKVLYPVAVNRPVPVAVEVEKPVERIVHKEVRVPYPVEKRVPYPVHYETRVPVPYPVEKRIPVPLERIVEKPVTVTKYVEKPVHIQVPVPQPVAVPVHVPQPYPVDRIVEKKVPYPVPVDRIVEKQVKVPYPVERIVEKIVEKPVVVTKYVDKPYPVEKKVPYPVEKIVEKRVPYPVQVPYELKVQYPSETLTPGSYAYGQAESILRPQYKSYQNKEDLKRQINANRENLYSQYYTLLKDKLKNSGENKLPVQTTRWGNQYASSYQYINNTVADNKIKIANYLNNLANAQSKSNNYYGPAPPPGERDWWQNKQNSFVDDKMRRADRELRLSNLNIEYGFQPPLIPSTQVDINGMPLTEET